MGGISELWRPLGVIAPVVPAVYQVLVPLLLMGGWALLLAAPRFLLGFCHWVWVRAVPESVLAGTSPDVGSRVFQGVAVSEFEDEHSFRVPGNRPELGASIVRFYERSGARVVGEGEGLTFRRGSRFFAILAHLIPWREKDFPQEIHVQCRRDVGNQLEVCVRYRVRAFYMIRTRPAGLEKEVRALRDVLAA
jgi:hypothetical protein